MESRAIPGYGWRWLRALDFWWRSRKASTSNLRRYNANGCSCSAWRRTIALATAWDARSAATLASPGCTVPRIQSIVSGVAPWDQCLVGLWHAMPSSITNSAAEVVASTTNFPLAWPITAIE